MRKGREPKHYAYRGQMLTITEIATTTGLHRATVERRLRAGVPLDLPDKRTLTDAERQAQGAGRRFEVEHYPKRLVYRHTVGSITDWATLTGLPPKTLRYRLDKLGWPVDRVLTEPLRA